MARLLKAIVPVLLYLAAFAAFTSPALAHFRTHFFGDAYDGIQNAWNLWWVHTALREGHNPWFTPYLFHPDGVTLVAHTLNPFNAFWTAPLAPALGPVVTYNLVVVFSFVASAYACFLLARAVTGLPAAALFAGAAFSFGSYHWAHAQGHMQLISMEGIPLFLLAWMSWLRKPSLPKAALAAFTLLLVTLCDYYYAVYCVIAAGVLFLFEAGRRRSPLFFLGGDYGLSFALFAGASALTSGALLVTLLLWNAGDPLQGAHDPVEGSLDLFALFVPGGYWRFSDLTSGYWSGLRAGAVEGSAYLGWTVILPALFAFSRDSRSGERRAAPWASVAVAFFILALGPRLHVQGTIHDVAMPYALLEWCVPAVRLSGVPARMSCMVLLAVALLAALGLPAFARRVLRTRAALVSYLCLFALDLWPAPLPLTPREVPDYVHALAGLPAGAVHLPENNGADEMLHQTVFGKPMTVGYISRTPASLAGRRYAIERHLVEGRYAEVFSGYGLRYLVQEDDHSSPPPVGLKRVYRGAERSIFVAEGDPLPASR